jgi:uncharacterized protein involved in outer membrane biogenesis
MSVRKRVLIVLAVVLLLPFAALGTLMLVVQTEWGERWVSSRVAHQLHRDVEIRGISLTPGWPPRIIFAHLRIGNPSWAKTPALIDADGLYARVAVPPLFAGRVVVPYIGARKATAGLEMDGKRATWRFGNDSQEESRLRLGLVFLDDGHIVFRDEGEATALDIDVKGSAGENGELRARASGTFRGEPAKASARIPNLDPQHEASIEVEGEASLGATKASAIGAFMADGSTLDLKLRLAGNTLAHLNKVTGMVLPETPPYQLAGRLRHSGTDWIFDPFEGKVGDSDLAGQLTYAKGGQKPLLRANLTSKLLDFDDLGPIIGAPPKTGPGETAAPQQQAQAAERAAASRLLPEQKFSTAAWGKMDADVTLSAKRVQRPKQLPIDTLATHLLLKDSVLRLEPLDFGVAGGRIRSTIAIDANQKPAHGTMKVDVQGLQLAPLFPTSKTMEDALGILYGSADLKGRGESIASLLGTSDGKMSLAVDGGRISALLVELIGLDVAESVMMLGRKHNQVTLRCAVAGFDVKQGVASTDSFVIDTSDTVIQVDGSVDLAQERLDLVTRPYPKDPSPLALRTPLLLKGPLRKPSVRPKAGPLAARVAGAVALGAVNPALALLALIETGPGKDAECARFLAEAKARGAVKKTAQL